MQETNYSKSPEILVSNIWILPCFEDDDGGIFRSAFTEAMRKMGVKHVKSSPHNCTSNGGELLRKEKINEVTARTDIQSQQPHPGW